MGQEGNKKGHLNQGSFPPININPGQHQHSNHFDSILSPHIAHPSPPAPHNPDCEQLINTAPWQPGQSRSQPTLSQPSAPSLQIAPPGATPHTWTVSLFTGLTNEPNSYMGKLVQLSIHCIFARDRGLSEMFSVHSLSLTH